MNQERKKLSWKSAILDTPGPGSPGEALLLFFKGVFMGVANIIPGVSGGTIALITGIYGELLLAIKSFSMDTIRHLVRFELKQAVNTLHLRFLIPVLAGLAVSILTVAQIMTYVFTNYRVYTWSLFFGLILASILVMAMQTGKWIGTGGLAFVIGAVLAYLFVGLIPVTTPESSWFIFVAGVVAIITMILPGLSGSFLLLILGKYEYIIGAVKNPFDLQNFIVLVVFGCGCIVGIAAFSRLMSVLLEKYENATMAVLTGIMCGCLRKVWPWKEVLKTVEIHGKVKTIAEANVLPQQLDTSLIIAVGFMVLGFILVIILEKTAKKES